MNPPLNPKLSQMKPSQCLASLFLLRIHGFLMNKDVLKGGVCIGTEAWKGFQMLKP
jgi:hypothetical protein